MFQSTSLLFGLITMGNLGGVIFAGGGSSSMSRLLTWFQATTLTNLVIEFLKINTILAKSKTRSTTIFKLLYHHNKPRLPTRHPAQDGPKVFCFILRSHLGSMTYPYFLNQARTKHTLNSRSLRLLNNINSSIFLRNL